MSTTKPISEKVLTRHVCDYLKLQYPGLIFTVDSSGMRLTQGQAVQMTHLRSSRGLPDLMIFEPRGEYHGLFIELKRDGTRLMKKDGNYASDHIREQDEMLQRLTDLGYVAMFAIGFDSAKTIIDNYLNS